MLSGLQDPQTVVSDTLDMVDVGTRRDGSTGEDHVGISYHLHLDVR